MDLVVRLNDRKRRELERMLVGIESQLPKIMAAAVNDTSKKTASAVAKGISARVAIRQKDLKPYIDRTRATAASPSAMVRLSESERIGLKYFQARQTAKGVTYRISKTEGRKMIPSAFGPNIGRLGGQVFNRRDKSRLPIDGPKRGPSPWGVFVQSGLEESVLQSTNEDLEKNMIRRVKLQLLRRAGKA